MSTQINLQNCAVGPEIWLSSISITPKGTSCAFALSPIPTPAPLMGPALGTASPFRAFSSRRRYCARAALALCESAREGTCSLSGTLSRNHLLVLQHLRRQNHHGVFRSHGCGVGRGGWKVVHLFIYLKISIYCFSFLRG